MVDQMTKYRLHKFQEMKKSRDCQKCIVETHMKVQLAAETDKSGNRRAKSAARASPALNNLM